MQEGGGSGTDFAVSGTAWFQNPQSQFHEGFCPTWPAEVASPLQPMQPMKVQVNFNSLPHYTMLEHLLQVGRALRLLS